MRVRPFRRWYDWRVHLVTDDVFFAAGLLEKVQGALDGGVDVVQLRLKHASKPEVLRWARAIQPMCAEAGAAFIVNDMVDVALEVDATGVHVGREDTSPREARKILGPEKVVGVSSYGEHHRVIDALDPEVDADYIGSGTTFPTATKTNEPVEGLESLSLLRSWVDAELERQGRYHPANAAGSPSYDEASWDLEGVPSAFARPPRALRGCPVVAIGGVANANAQSCIQAGADGLASVSGLLSVSSSSEAQERARAMVNCAISGSSAS